MGSCTGVDTRVNQKIIYVMSYFSEYHDGHMINEIYQGLKDINYVSIITEDLIDLHGIFCC